MACEQPHDRYVAVGELKRRSLRRAAKPRPALCFAEGLSFHLPIISRQNASVHPVRANVIPAHRNARARKQTCCKA